MSREEDPVCRLCSNVSLAGRIQLKVKNVRLLPVDAVKVPSCAIFVPHGVPVSRSEIVPGFKAVPS